MNYTGHKISLRLLLNIILFLVLLLIINNSFTLKDVLYHYNKKRLVIFSYIMGNSTSINTYEYTIDKINRSTSNSTQSKIKNFSIFNQTLNDEIENLISTIKVVNRKLVKDYCNLVPSHLLGNITIKEAPSILNAFNLYKNKSLIESQLDLNFMRDLRLGGSWEPSDCKARHNVAIVIPYRNRKENLNSFLYNMHPFLQRQELNYTIFVAEQVNDELFNKGILMNAAFMEIFNKSNYNFQCIIFHDVDLLPTGMSYCASKSFFFIINSIFFTI
jgi:hypothetical protein